MNDRMDNVHIEKSNEAFSARIIHGVREIITKPHITAIKPAISSPRSAIMAVTMKARSAHLSPRTSSGPALIIPNGSFMHPR